MMTLTALLRIVKADVLKNVKFIVEGPDPCDQVGSPNLLLGSKNVFTCGRPVLEWNPKWRDVVRTLVQGERRNAHVSAFRSTLSGSPHLFKQHSYVPSCMYIHPTNLNLLLSLDSSSPVNNRI